MWLSKFVPVWSNINALAADSGDHTTSCYAHIPARCIPLCHKNCARVARPSLRVLVMQYIQCCGGSGLVHETKYTRWHALPYSRKIWRGIKFGGLAVYYYNRQIKIRQNFLLAYIRMAIPYRTAKFKSANIILIAILGSTAKFNARQYFRLYGM